MRVPVITRQPQSIPHQKTNEIWSRHCRKVQLKPIGQIRVKEKNMPEIESAWLEINRGRSQITDQIALKIRKNQLHLPLAVNSVGPGLGRVSGNDSLMNPRPVKNADSSKIPASESFSQYWIYIRSGLYKCGRYCQQPNRK